APIRLLPRKARAFHFADQATHRRRTDLLRRGELANGLRTAHENRQRRELRRRDAGQRIRAARSPKKMKRRRVEAVGDAALASLSCAFCHAVILVSKANKWQKRGPSMAVELFTAIGSGDAAAVERLI